MCLIVFTMQFRATNLWDIYLFTLDLAYFSPSNNNLIGFYYCKVYVEEKIRFFTVKNLPNPKCIVPISYVSNRDIKETFIVVSLK